MMQALEKKITLASFIGTSYSSGDKTFVVKTADNFSYMDPIDQSVAMKQVGTFFFFILTLFYLQLHAVLYTINNNEINTTNNLYYLAKDITSPHIAYGLFQGGPLLTSGKFVSKSKF